MASPSPEPGAESGHELSALPPRVVFYDGICNVCDRSVRFILDHDAAGHFHFAPLQGTTAERVRRALPRAFPDDLDTLALLDNSGAEARLLLRSQAAFAILTLLPTAPRWLRGLKRIPRPLCDLVYRLFARTRYRLFGRLDACRIPAPEERARFLD